MKAFSAGISYLSWVEWTSLHDRTRLQVTENTQTGQDTHDRTSQYRRFSFDRTNPSCQIESNVQFVLETNGSVNTPNCGDIGPSAREVRFNDSQREGGPFRGRADMTS
jgi:hypothetical protein